MADTPVKKTPSNSSSSNVEELLSRFAKSMEKEMETHLARFSEELTKHTQSQIDRQLEHAVSGLQRRIERMGKGDGDGPVVDQQLHESVGMNDHGVQLFYRNELEQAEHVLLDATRVNPDSVEIWNNLGVVYTALKQTEKAVKCFRTAAELNPDYTDLLNNRAVLALLDNNPEKALELLEKAESTGIRQIPVLLNLAQAYEAMELHSKAVRAWKLVLAIDPHQEEANQNLRQFYQ